MVLPADYEEWDQYFPNPISEFWRKFLSEIHDYSEDTFWDDLTFPLAGEKLSSPAGRMEVDFTTVLLDFQSNAVYPTDLVTMSPQMRHKWAEGTGIFPHIHWMQNQNADPNWLYEYLIRPKGAVETAWTLAIPATQRAFTYTSGRIHQITLFPEIDMTGYGISDMMAVKLYRDTSNASGLFSGADAYTGDAESMEFDIHYQIDMPGSRQEYIK